MKFVTQILFMNKECAPITVWRAMIFIFQIQKGVRLVLVQPFWLNEHSELCEEPLMKHNKINVRCIRHLCLLLIKMSGADCRED